MQFGAFMRDEARDRGSDALEAELSYNQKNILMVSILHYPTLFLLFSVCLHPLVVSSSLCAFIVF